MKNIIKSLTILFVVSLATTSCILDDEAFVDTFSDNPNFSTFTESEQNIGAVADGNDIIFPIPLTVDGPNLGELSQDVTVTISIDPSSTAIEGEHYTFDSMSVILSSDQNYIGTIPLTIITAGITPPLDINPILKLNIESTSGGNVISSDRTITILIVYQCFADLSGTYDVANSFGCPQPEPATITANSDGSWHLSTADGYWLSECTGNNGLYNYGDITELCGVILPSNRLEYGGLPIGTITGGTWDPVTGTLMMDHTEAFFTNGPYAWSSIYVRQ